MMERHGHGVDLLTSISLRAICLVCFAFVDDTDLVISGRDRFTKGEDIKEEFQVALDRWAGGLIATGGALAPAKSFCYMIDFLNGHERIGSIDPWQTCPENSTCSWVMAQGNHSSDMRWTMLKRH